MQPYVFTQHALMRLDRRGISPETLHMVLSHGEHVTQENGNNRHTLRLGKRTIEVITDKSNTIIVTAWTKDSGYQKSAA